FIKSDIPVIELGYFQIHIQQILITLDTAIDIAVVKSPNVFGEKFEIRIHLAGRDDKTEFLVAQLHRIRLNITRIIAVQKILKSRWQFLYGEFNYNGHLELTAHDSDGFAAVYDI